MPGETGSVPRAARLRAPVPSTPPSGVLDELVVLWRDEAQADEFERLAREDPKENLKKRLEYMLERKLVQPHLPSTGWCVQLVERNMHMCWTPGTFGGEGDAYAKSFVYSIGAQALYGTPNVLVVFDEDDTAFSTLFRPQDLGGMVNDLVSGVRHMPKEDLDAALAAGGVEVNSVLDHTKPFVRSQAGSVGRQTLVRVTDAETAKYLGYLTWFAINFRDTFDVNDTLVLHLGVRHVLPEMCAHTAMHYAERAFDFMQWGMVDKADKAFAAVTEIARASPPGGEVLLVDLARLHGSLLVQAERWADALRVMEHGVKAQEDGKLDVGEAYTLLLGYMARATAGLGEADSDACKDAWRAYRAAATQLTDTSGSLAEFEADCAKALGPA